MAISIMLLPPLVIIVIVSIGGSARWWKFFLSPHRQSMLRAAANAANDSNRNQTAVIPHNDGLQLPTSPPLALSYGWLLYPPCCCLLDGHKEGWQWHNNCIKVDKGVDLLLPSVPPQLPSKGSKGREMWRRTLIIFVMAMVACSDSGLPRQRMEVVMVWWQVAMKKVLKQTIHGCFGALCTGRGQC